jgi:hypothetical protein
MFGAARSALMRVFRTLAQEQTIDSRGRPSASGCRRFVHRSRTLLFDDGWRATMQRPAGTICDVAYAGAFQRLHVFRPSGPTIRLLRGIDRGLQQAGVEVVFLHQTASTTLRRIL